MILRKTKRYFVPVGDILKSKRYFYCILHVERSARRFYLRKKHIGLQIATVYSILWKGKRYFVPVGNISPINSYLCSILVDECYARLCSRRNKPNCAQVATIYSILRKSKRYFVPVGDISPINRLFLRDFSERKLRTSVATSKQVQMFAKCNLLPDIGEKTALILSCWRYFDV